MKRLMTKMSRRSLAALWCVLLVVSSVGTTGTPGTQASGPELWALSLVTLPPRAYLSIVQR